MNLITNNQEYVFLNKTDNRKFTFDLPVAMFFFPAFLPLYGNGDEHANGRKMLRILS